MTDRSPITSNVSDRDPATVVALVRDVVLQRNVAVAERIQLDIWGARTSWDEWRHFDVGESGVSLSEKKSDFERFRPGEVQQLLGIAEKLVGPDELPAAREELEKGGDGLLKMLVIASAPQLQSVNFIWRQDLAQKGCQAWLHKAIRHQLASGNQWPPGLQSLRNVAVGINAKFSNEDPASLGDRARAEWEGHAEVSTLMRLPSLKSLYYHTKVFSEEEEEWSDCDDSDDEDNDDDDDKGDEDLGEVEDRNPEVELAQIMRKKSSTVTHLYLDHVRGEYTETPAFLLKLLAMPRALESCAIRWRDGEFDPSGILGSMHQHDKSLRQMMFYNPGSMVGYRCSAYRPEDLPEGPLSMWWQSAEDVELQALYDSKSDHATREDVINTFLKYLDREQAEVIILDGDLPGDHIDDQEQKLSYYEDALLALIRSAGSKNLKALFIDFPEEADSDGDVHSPDGFAKVVRLADEMGVDLYGSKHLKHKRRHALNFPRAPSKWDIVTGPWFAKRVEEGYTEYDCVGDNWSKPENDEYAWHYVEPKAGP